MGNIGIQPVIDRLAPAHGNTLRYHGYPCTYRIPLCANTIKIGFELWHNGRSGRKKCILSNRVPALKWNIDFAKLAHIATDDNAIALLQPLFSNGAGGNTDCGLSRTGTAATAIIANAVFLPVGVVGMTRPEGVGNIAVILAALVFIADQQGDGGTCSLAFENAGEDFNRIGFLALCNMARSTGFAAIQICLDIGSG